MQLTKKQRKALQFRGKLEKPAKEDRPEKPAKETPAAEPPAEKKPKFERRTNDAGSAIRFIAFVGNLPYKTTGDELRVFLKAANPTSVRLMTDKQTGNSRGFAFVEFASSADMRRALKFHHQQLGTKKINVELTAGGGGNSAKRKEKLDKRRVGMDKEREKERKTKRRKQEAKEAAGDGEEGSDGDEGAGEDGQDAAEQADVEQEDPAADQEATKAKKPNRRKRGRGSR
ncbi:hypothetical protein LPJ63_004986 [Coemansia sp. RSA 2711]|nr:hypothetical protein LPJ63_004986 [Coemansia sp. RSA 2711]KAJ2314877.1 hypothetical protein IWW54_000643 [Coemansia sp. RSA 2705]KAJ2320515.1 hypothetical protein IWW52_001325 [Coemansia sp. RSA 2704]KAJ2737474.1 hypothetical protein H4R23_001821 [Coemansia sp. Cherry 401B]